MVRLRADPLRGDDHPAARLPRPRALPLHDRGGRDRAAAAAARARDRRSSQRRLPRRRDRPAVVPAGRVREDRDHHLPGQLPARHAPAAGHRRAAVPRHHDPAAQALRPAAASSGARDGDAVRHPGPRLVADVLRRLPGRPLRRDEPHLVRRDRPGAVRRRVVGPLPRPPDDHEPRRRLAAPVRRRSTTSRAAATRSPSRCSRRPTAGCSAGASGRRCSRSARATTRSSCCPRRRPTSSTRSSSNELGLLGAAAVICTYLLAVERGFKIATLARDSFSKLLATGLTAVFALQVFVIVGGVTQRHPAHRRDAAVHLLRRLVDPRELRAAGAAAAHLRPRAARRPRRRHERADRPPLRRRSSLLFGVLVVGTSWNTVFGADELRDKPQNRRQLLEQQRIRRGAIRAARRLGARSQCAQASDDTLHPPLSAGRAVRPRARLLVHALRPRRPRALAQRRAERARRTSSGSIFDRLSGTQPEGDDVRTTLDPAAQRVALQQLAGRKGAVVALDPRTGAVKVMASVPGYDPNAIGQPGPLHAPQPATRTRRCSTAPRRPATRPARRSRSSPRSRRSTAASYTPDSLVSGRNRQADLRRAAATTSAARTSAHITLTDALTHSVNTACGEVGEKLGKRTMAKYMDRLGFDEPVQVDLPARRAARRAASSSSGKLIPADQRRRRRRAHGHRPGQAQRDAAADGDGRRRRRQRRRAHEAAPRPTGSSTATGAPCDRIQPREMSQVMSGRDRRRGRAAMMGKVVEEGTGTAAALEGIDVAGKTGTAEVDHGCPNQVWFIAFAPLHDPKVAIAATVECSAGTRRRRRRADRQGRHAGAARSDRAPRLRDDRRRPLPRPQPRRLGRDGRRLLRRGPAARAPGRAQGPAPPLRRGPRVRRALPARGVAAPRASSTSTSSPSTTAASGTAPTTSRWSSSTAAR